MTTLRRALVLGIAFGFAAATVEAWLQFIPFMQRRMGAGAGLMLKTAGLEIVLGAVLGLVAAPLLRLRAGTFLHIVAMALCWYGLERWVTIESPLFARFEPLPPLGGALLLLVALRIARWRWQLPWAFGAVVLAGAIAAPPIFLYMTTPPQAPLAVLPPARPGAPDVVLVVLDTVRAQSVSTYGYARPTAPTLDALAREGALFLDATSPSTWSLPSHASLFTGVYPSSHNAHAEHQFLDDRYPTLAQVLAHNGYETFCFTSNAWISDGLGLTRGFAHQDESLRNQGGAGLGFSFIHRLLDRLGLQETDKGGRIVVGSFADWAAARPADAERPAFVFLNFIEAHFPYHQLPHEHLFRFTDLPYGTLRSLSIDLLGQQFGGPGRPLEEARQPARDMYDGGVVHTSNLLGGVVEALRARGTLDRTVLVVLADHGEILGERGGFFGHGPSFYQESVGVPLLIRFPPAVPAGAKVTTPVSTLGAFATILDLAGLEAPPTLQVDSLVPLLQGGTAGQGGPILAELHMQPDRVVAGAPPSDPQMHRDRRYRMFREGPLKLVTSSAGDALLYDLSADPGETRNLAPERPADVRRMQERLAAVQSQLGLPDLDAPLAADGETPAFDQATRERLRELGYVQ